MVLSVIRSEFFILLTTRGRRLVTLPQCNMTWLTSVNSLPIFLKLPIMIILVAQILKMCLTHPIVVSAVFDFPCPISGFDANKGSGNDVVPPSFIKVCAAGLKSPLLYIFNLSLSTNTFPSKWKDFSLNPIFKTGK
jgi:hypothetical protein